MKLAKPSFILSFVLAAGVCQAAITTEVIGNFNGECVAYARQKVPSLPSGLYTLADKKKVINSRTCKAGSVAIIDVGNYGHVAVVEKCDSSGSTQSITITEANYKPGKITRRQSKVSKISKAESELKILGYYRP